MSSFRGRTELKTVDVDLTVANLNTTTSIILLNGIAAGTDFTDRIGRKVMLKSIQLRGYIVPEDQTVSDTALRILVVYDNQTNGVAPAVTDVLKTANPVSMLNLNNRDRFKVIWDIQKVNPFFANTATQAVAGGNTVHNIKKYRKLNLETIFGGTAATVGSIQTGSIYLITIGTNASTAGAVLGFTSRIRFMDS